MVLSDTATISFAELFYIRLRQGTDSGLFSGLTKQIIELFIGLGERPVDIQVVEAFSSRRHYVAVEDPSNAPMTKRPNSRTLHNS